MPSERPPQHEYEDMAEALGPSPGTGARASSRPLAGAAPADADTLLVFIGTLGPLTKRGKYRIRLVLYDGFQPLEAAPGVLVGASTHHRELTREKKPLPAACTSWQHLPFCTYMHSQIVLEQG